MSFVKDEASVSFAESQLDLSAINSFVGDRLRAWREARDSSQEYIADVMSGYGFRWSQETVSKIETGTRRMTVDELVGLVFIFDADLPSLLPQP